MDFICGLNTFSCFLMACVLAVGLQVLFFSPISPDILQLPSNSASIHAASNSKLQEITKLGEGLLVNPEDTAIDKEGVLYTATSDGWIKRLHKNGSWENWKWIDSYGLLGMAPSRGGGVFVCDTEQGLFKVTEDGVILVASHVKGDKIRQD